MEQCRRARKTRAALVRRIRRTRAEFRKRAGRLVFEHQDEYPTQCKAIESIAGKLKVKYEARRQWVPRAETDGARRPGVTTMSGPG